MNDRDKISFNESEEEEFHITDEDIDRELAAMEDDQAVGSADAATGDNAPPAAAPKRAFAKLKQLKRKHWVIIAVVVLVLLIGLLKLAGNKPANNFDQITPLAAPAKITTTAPAKATQTDLTKTTLPVSRSTPSAKTDSFLSTPNSKSSGNDQIKSNISSVASNESKLIESLQTIQEQNTLLTKQLTALSGRVQGLETAFSQSNQAVEGLAQEVVQLQSTSKSVKPTLLPKVAPPPPTEVVNEPAYSVEAVVPQRAWLQAADGSTVTVMIGDDVRGLGTVLAIDPYSGNVTTSSGAILKYAN